MSDIPMILDRVGTKLVVETAQLFDGHYASGSIIISGLIATMAGEAFDGLADRLNNDITLMAELLRAGGVDPGDVTRPTLKLSDLQPLHDRLSAELITLQERIETQPGDAAAALNARIWGFFVAGATARMPSPPQFEEQRADAAEKLKAEGGV